MTDMLIRIESRSKLPESKQKSNFARFEPVKFMGGIVEMSE